ncbi:hypothetical protein HMPREF0569_1591 [Micrococcus luteus SK58]|uniref:hypothetical protein n=1 Tax=Micrococcus luteus TaxID=1270 RepID=UPI0001C4FFE5|nr:hypothetical protein [Micrococcus luteus]EFD50338.1 hypothetical protein HMPREF0569_1591 [Micrococcus luteus SK58]
MPYALRKPCAEAGCPRLVGAGRRYCDEHQGSYERRRGTRQQRGYGPGHEAVRERMRPAVEAGTALCVRCGRYIKPGDAWVADHNEDRSGYLGPAHRKCNDAAGGRAVRHRGAATR